MSTSCASIDCLEQSQIGKMGSLHSSIMILAWLDAEEVMNEMADLLRVTKHACSTVYPTLPDPKT